MVESRWGDKMRTVSRSEHQGRITAVVRLVQRRALRDVFLHPVIVPIHAVAPDVRLLGHELARLWTHTTHPDQ